MKWAEARARHDWTMAASIMAHLSNIHRGRKGRAAKPEDFHPLARPKRRTRDRGIRVGIRALKSVWIDHKPPPEALL